MALHSIGILGSALVGPPLAGALADAAGMPYSLLTIAAICAGTGATAAWAWLKQ